MRFTSNLLFALVSLWCITSSIAGILVNLLRNNVAGQPVNFQQQSWPIDPEEGLRRMKNYVEANGLYGYKHVERIGLGEDGRMEERKLQQAYRDSIGALSLKVPP